MEITRSDLFSDNITQNYNHQHNRGFSEWRECPIRAWLKEYDDNLDMMLNTRTGRVRVVDNTFHCIMEVDYHAVHYGLVEQIKRIDSRNGYRAIQEIERNELKMKMDHQNKMDDLSYNLAKDMRKPLANSV